MFNSLLCYSEPDDPPAGHADPNTILPPPEAPDALDNTTPLVVHAYTNITPVGGESLNRRCLHYAGEDNIQAGGPSAHLSVEA